MILAIGLSLLGVVAMGRAHRRCRGVTARWRGPWEYGYGGIGGSWTMHAALARLDVTPAQQRQIYSELERLRGRVREARAGLSDARGDLAAAVRGPRVDDAALGAALGRFDAAVLAGRTAALDALRSIHGVLDDTQRERLGHIVAGTPAPCVGGPYR